MVAKSDVVDDDVDVIEFAVPRRRAAVARAAATNERD